MASSLSIYHHHLSSSLRPTNLDNAKLSSSFCPSPFNLSSSPIISLQFLYRKQSPLLSSTPRVLTVIAMAPPKPGGKSKKVVGVIKLALEAGKATPAPPVGPALGAKGVNIMGFCKDYNARTADKAGYVIPVEITVYDDKSFTFILKTPPASVLLLKAAGVEKGSKDPKQEKVGKITIDQLRAIATEKLPDLNCTTIESAMRIIAGTAANMGIDVDPPLLESEKKELYNFEGRYDLVKFVKIVQQAGMYMILRIGPFVAAEWNFGGIPVWLHYVPGTVFRTDNKSFKYYMQKFTTFIVNLMKQEKLFASQGGPIILAQVENEYGYYESYYGEGAKRYVKWAAEMAVSQNIGVPWIMCQQDDAPDPVINTCNSFYCDQFRPNSPNKPKIWTENWPGWFKTFGARDPHRPAEDVAFSVARFFQKGGSVHNYYMYHGGTNFGRTAGGPFITTSYDYEAPIDEYGLPRLPKWGHLKELHKAIKLSEHALLKSEPLTLSLGPSQEADVYDDGSGTCAAFLANMDDRTDKNVLFRNVSYHLPAWSVSILPDCKNVVFNTAKVGSQASVVEMVSEELQPSVASPSKGLKALKWEIFVENAGIWGVADFTKNGFVDHINTTKDTTDYLWYTTSIIVGENEEFLKKGSRPVLLIESKGHALHAFVNQELQGSASGNGTHSPFKFKNPITLKPGKNEIALLSMTVGLQNAGGLYEWVGAGLTSVKIEGLNNGTIDLSMSSWTYKIGLQGEHLGIYKPDGSDGVKWVSTSEPPKNQPLTWYKVEVDPPSGDEPVGLDMLHMGKGLAWLNGEEIGRYWPIKSSKHEKCIQECDYRGKFFPDKCLTGCGEPTQRWYHVPRSWFKPSGNILVIFEEKGGDPTKITFSKRKTSGLCSLVAEDYPMVDQESITKNGSGNDKTRPTVHLKCPKNASISNVKFASFGNPTGRCGTYSKGDCHDPNSTVVVEKVCLGKNECVIELTEENFDKGLCSGTTKKLAVEAVCS